MNTKYTAFAGCPPGSDTSHVRGLVDTSGLRQLRMLLVVLMLLELHRGVQGVAHIKRLGKQDVLYMRLTLIEIIGDLCYIYAPM